MNKIKISKTFSL